MAVPNTATFVYIGEMPFSYVHALAVLSAQAVNGFDRMRLICDRRPQGKWWDLCSPHLDVELVNPPTSVYGVPLRHPAHVTDVIRMQEMLDHGGVFLDLDVLCVAPLKPLMNEAFVVGQQEASYIDPGVGCAIMLSEPESPFVREWAQGYDPKRSLWSGFRSEGRDEHWSEMSTRYPSMLAERHPDLITVVPPAAFYPFNWEEDALQKLFVDSLEVPAETKCIHLWESRSFDRFLTDLGPGDVAQGLTTFTHAAREAFRDSDFAADLIGEGARK